MKRAFTLLEILMVVMIVTILAGIGIPQYLKAVEKGRSVEAKAVLGQIRNAEEAYYAKNGTYTSDLTLLDIEANINTADTCTSDYWYKFSIPSADAAGFTARARRCTESGKEPQATTEYSITLNQDGGWGGTTGYTY